MTEQSEVSLASTKYARGMNPASRANLKMWPKGVSGNPGQGVPVITPAIRRLALLSTEELMALEIGKLKLPEAVAVTYWLNALDEEKGARSRSELTDRLDGVLAKPVELQDNRVQVVIQQYAGIDPEEIPQ